MATDVFDLTRRVTTMIDIVEIGSADALDEPSLAAFVRDLHALRGVVDTWLTRSAELATQLGDTPPADVIRADGATSRRESERISKRSAALADYDRLADATRSGDLPATSFDQINRAGESMSAEDRSRFEQRLVDADAGRRADEMPPESFARWVNGIADQIDADRRARDHAAREAKSYARTWADERSGMTHLHAEFDEVRGTTIEKMLDDECRSILARSKKGERTWSPRLRADALYELLRRGATGESGPARYAGIVVVDAETAATGRMRDGSICRLGPIDLPPSTAARLLCDSTLRRVVMGAGGEILDVGRKVRDATPAQRAALEALYGGCCWPGCDAPFRATHIHHIHEWEHGGPTDLDNLRPLCVRHHHDVHEGGWRIEVRRGGEVAFHRPDGSLWQVATAPGAELHRTRVRSSKRSDASTQMDTARSASSERPPPGSARRAAPAAPPKAGPPATDPPVRPRAGHPRATRATDLDAGSTRPSGRPPLGR